MGMFFCSFIASLSSLKCQQMPFLFHEKRIIKISLNQVEIKCGKKWNLHCFVPQILTHTNVRKPVSIKVLSENSSSRYR